jgi:hypothetical protein
MESEVHGPPRAILKEAAPFFQFTKARVKFLMVQVLSADGGSWLLDGRRPTAVADSPTAGAGLPALS